MPIYDLTLNKDFADRPIAKETYTKGQEAMVAEAGLYKKNVNSVAKWFTDRVYELGGGDTDLYVKTTLKDGKLNHISSFADFNPSKLEHLVTYYTGGRGKFFNDVFKTSSSLIEDMANKVKGNGIEQKFEWADVPIVSRLNRTGYGKNIYKEYYKMKDEIEAYDYAFDKLAPDKQGNNINPEILIKKDIIKKTEKELRKLKEYEKKAIEANDPKLVQDINDLKKETITQYMKIVTR